MTWNDGVLPAQAPPAAAMTATEFRGLRLKLGVSTEALRHMLDPNPMTGEARSERTVREYDTGRREVGTEVAASMRALAAAFDAAVDEVVTGVHAEGVRTIRVATDSGRGAAIATHAAAKVPGLRIVGRSDG